MPGWMRDFRLAIDARTKALIARGTKETVEQVAKLVDALDSSNDELPERIGTLKNVRLIKFARRNLVDVQNVLTGLGIEVYVTCIPRSATQELWAACRTKPGGTLIATGPEEDLHQVADLIKSLDVEDAAPRSSGPAMPMDTTPSPSAPRR